jgi:hypothetical protein
MKKTIDNIAPNVVILTCWSIGILCRKQRIFEFPDRKAVRQQTFCFYAVGKSTAFFRRRLFEAGTKYSEVNGYPYLVKTIMMFRRVAEAQLM